MNYLILIIVAVVGIGLGAYFARRNGAALSEQSRQKHENKKKVLAFVRENPNQLGADGQGGKVTNDDVEKMLSVSNATAERYLDELEKDGKLVQHGTTGQNVFYVLK